MVATTRLLVVCTANVCRSVYSSAILANMLSPSWRVQSAGIDAVEGASMCSSVRDLIEKLAIELPPQHSDGAVRLQQHEVQEADLILTFTTSQRARVARLEPSARARLFTLLEAVDLAQIVGPNPADGQPNHWVAQLNAKRPLLGRGDQPRVQPPRRWWQPRKESTQGVSRWDLADAHFASPEKHEYLLQTVAQASRSFGSSMEGLA